MLKVHPDVTLICDKEAYAKERIGVDIGGTEIKFGVLDEDNKLICKKSIPTVADSVDTILSAIEQECRILRLFILPSAVIRDGRYKNRW